MFFLWIFLFAYILISGYTSSLTAFWPTGKNELCSDVGVLPATYDQCQDALLQIRSYFSKITTVYQGSWSNFPKGCYMRENSHNHRMYANSHPTGSRHSSYGQVCTGLSGKQPPVIYLDTDLN